MSLARVKGIVILSKPLAQDREDQFIDAFDDIFFERLRESVNFRRKLITIWTNETLHGQNFHHRLASMFLVPMLSTSNTASNQLLLAHKHCNDYMETGCISGFENGTVMKAEQETAEATAAATASDTSISHLTNQFLSISPAFIG